MRQISINKQNYSECLLVFMLRLNQPASWFLVLLMCSFILFGEEECELCLLHSLLLWIIDSKCYFIYGNEKNADWSRRDWITWRSGICCSWNLSGVIPTCSLFPLGVLSILNRIVCFCLFSSPNLSPSFPPGTKPT